MKRNIGFENKIKEFMPWLKSENFYYGEEHRNQTCFVQYPVHPSMSSRIHYEWHVESIGIHIEAQKSEQIGLIPYLKSHIHDDRVESYKWNNKTDGGIKFKGVSVEDNDIDTAVSYLKQMYDIINPLIERYFLDYQIWLNPSDFESAVMSYNPGAKFKYGQNFFFASANEYFGEEVHYEYYDNHIQLHVEGCDDAKSLIAFLVEKLPVNDLYGFDKWQRRINGRYIIKQKIEPADVNSIINAFHEFYSLVNPVLEEYIANNPKKQNMAPQSTPYDKYINLLKENSNLVLTGAPGTGKTYLAKEIVKAMNAVEGFVQFHPSYDYTDFVEGLRPKQDGGNSLGFERRNGIFKDFCKDAIENWANDEKTGSGEPKPYVFIIDEINRGELSKIFGELFYSIDPGYRGTKGKVKTQYQNLIKEDDVFADGFFIPENVYILATMNDIDRSVESMDFAMRRRFSFLEVKPEDRVEMLDVLGDQKDLAIKKMNALNQVIKQTQGLGAAYQIGPAYFRKLKEGNFARLWEMNIEPLLREYLRGMVKVEETMKKFHEAFFPEEIEQEPIEEADIQEAEA